jgi:hypothetical protein
VHDQPPQFVELQTLSPFSPGSTPGVPRNPSRIWSDLLVSVIEVAFVADEGQRDRQPRSFTGLD